MQHTRIPPVLVRTSLLILLAGELVLLPAAMDFPSAGTLIPALGLFLVLVVAGPLLFFLSGRWKRLSSVEPETAPRPPAAVDEGTREQPSAPAAASWRDRAVESATEGLWHWDLQTKRFTVSAEWAGTLGYKPSELEPNSSEWFNAVHADYLPGLRMDLSAHLNGKTKQFRSEYRIRHRDGTYRWVLCRGRAVRDENGKAIEIAGSQTDVTRLIDVEQRLIHDAFHDRVTGLPNRNSFLANLNNAVEQAKTDSRSLFALVFMDIDGFKGVNDSLGHVVGDELLASIASRLTTCVRPGDVVARFGGDEFVVLLRDLHDFSEAEHVAKRLQKAIGEPFQLSEHEVLTQASIGLVPSTVKFKAPEDLIRNADIAMYSAKSEGKGRTKVFTPSMYLSTVQSWSLQNDLQKAQERGEICLHYQPSISMKDGRICGAEALARWTRADGKSVPPSEFIPCAEESDLIISLGEWVLRTACEEAQSWRQEGSDPVKICVNVSARQLARSGFARTVRRALADSGLAPELLELEVTESVLIESLKTASVVLRSLQGDGVRIAIDDFGTGYSSLGYLRKFPADTLKLDRSFITEVNSDRHAAALAKAVIQLAHDLDFHITAEGVEDVAQAEFLCGQGCDQLQGFLASRPVPAGEFRRLLAARPSFLSAYTLAAAVREQQQTGAAERAPYAPSLYWKIGSNFPVPASRVTSPAAAQHNGVGSSASVLDQIPSLDKKRLLSAARMMTDRLVGAARNTFRLPAA